MDGNIIYDYNISNENKSLFEDTQKLIEKMCPFMENKYLNIAYWISFISDQQEKFSLL